LFDSLRRKRGAGAGQLRQASKGDVAHLQEWTASRIGVEAYVEPRTTVTETTVVLIAHDGEWTRRRVSGPDAAKQLGKQLKIPVYDAGIVGYPKRMREYTARQAAERKRNGLH
jgi:hypothetical protein